MMSNILLPLLALCAGLNAQTVSQEPSLLNLISKTPQLSMYNATIYNDTRLVNLLSSQAFFDIYLSNNAGIQKFSKDPQFGDLLNDKQVVLESTLYTIVPRGFSDPQGPSAFLHTLRNYPAVSKVYGGETFRLDIKKTLLSGLLTTSNVVKTLPFDSGDLHVVDFPLTPPQNLSVTAASTNITELKTFVKSKNLGSIQSFNDITLFVLDAGRRYELVRGTVAYSSFFVERGTKVTAISGNALYLARRGNVLTVNSTPVKTADILVENGVTHIVGGS